MSCHHNDSWYPDSNTNTKIKHRYIPFLIHIRKIWVRLLYHLCWMAQWPVALLPHSPRVISSILSSDYCLPRILHVLLSPGSSVSSHLQKHDSMWITYIYNSLIIGTKSTFTLTRIIPYYRTVTDEWTSLMFQNVLKPDIWWCVRMVNLAFFQ